MKNCQKYPKIQEQYALPSKLFLKFRVLKIVLHYRTYISNIEFKKHKILFNADSIQREIFI